MIPIHHHARFHFKDAVYQTRGIFPGGRSQRKLVILAHGRSGGTLLCRLLDSRPDFICREEILSTRLTFPRQFLRGHAARFCDRQRGFGFRAKFEHLDQLSQHRIQGALDWFQEQGWGLVHLRRMNPVRHALSILVGKAQQQWHPGKDKQLPKVFISPEQLLKVIEYRLADQRKYENYLNGRTHLKITYEEHLQTEAQQQFTCDRIMQILSMPSCKVYTELRRSNPEWSTNLENPDAIRSTLKKHDLERYLFDDWDLQQHSFKSNS